MKQHEKNAIAVATFLESSPHVSEVIYPGLPSHKQHQLAKRQASGFGGMVTFRLKADDVATSNKFLQNLSLFALAESLGGVESLAELPSVMTHAALTPEARADLGVSDGLVRLSCGVEDTEDLLADIKNALNACGK